SHLSIVTNNDNQQQRQQHHQLQFHYDYSYRRNQSINRSNGDYIIDLLNDRSFTFFIQPMICRTLHPTTPPSPRLVTFKMSNIRTDQLYRPLKRYHQRLETILEQQIET
ncbi:hypothetical protein BLA29_008320, partial [Euroglyphus maynei]